MSKVYSVGYIVGSISTTSINRRLAGALRKLAPEVGLELHEIPIRELPHYCPDYDENQAECPDAAVQYRRSVSAVDGVLIVTPEYNRSIPGVLKNALDWASRPKDAAPFGGKPSYVVGASPGAIGTAVAQQHLRSILSFLASPELAQPEVYLQYRPGMIDDDDVITIESTREFLRFALQSFAAHLAFHCDSGATDRALNSAA